MHNAEQHDDVQERTGRVMRLFPLFTLPHRRSHDVQFIRNGHVLADMTGSHYRKWINMFTLTILFFPSHSAKLGNNQDKHKVL